MRAYEGLGSRLGFRVLVLGVGFVGFRLWGS